MSLVNIAGTVSKSKLTNVQEGDVQPNAVDLRAQRMFEIDGGTPFAIGGVDDAGKELKVHRKKTEIFPQPGADGQEYFILEPGKAYEVLMDNKIGVAVGESGWKITRSTLVRNGVVVFSGLYDAGYGLGEDEPTGAMGGVIFNPIGFTYIAPNTRIAQYVCVEAETLHKYDGDYQKGNRQGDRYEK